MDSAYLSCLGVFATRQSSRLCRILVVLLQMQYIFSAPIPPHTLLPTFQDSKNLPVPLLSSLHTPNITKDASDLLTNNPNVKLPAADVLSFILSLEEAAERGELTSAVVLPLLHGGQTTTPAVTILLSTSTSTPIERLSSTSFQVFSTPQPQKSHEDLFSSGPTVSTSCLDTTTTPHLAPGIVVSDSEETANPTPTTLIIPSSSPVVPLHTSPPSPLFSPSVSDLPLVTPLRIADDPDPEGSSYRGLITAASVILALIVISAVIFTLCSNRTLRRSLFWRANKDPSWPVAEKFAVSPSPSQTAEVNAPTKPQRPAWMKLPSQIAALHLVRSPQASFASLVTRKTPQPKDSSPFHTRLQDKEIVRLKNKVVDIIPDFPRSRWSVTSSDYSSSIKLDEDKEYHQTTSNSRLPLQSGNQKQMRSANRKFAPVSLLTPEEFFSLPTSDSRLSNYSDCAAGYSSRCHRRRSSAPVFGRNRRVAGLSMASYKARASVGRCSVKFVDGQGAKETVVPMSINPRPSEHRKLHSVATIGDSQWI